MVPRVEDGDALRALRGRATVSADAVPGDARAGARRTRRTGSGRRACRARPRSMRAAAARRTARRRGARASRARRRGQASIDGHGDDLLGERRRADCAGSRVASTSPFAHRAGRAAAHASRSPRCFGKMTPARRRRTWCPARPMRWSPPATDGGASIWITRSMAPMSMPSSSDEVATMRGQAARLEPLFDLAAAARGRPIRGARRRDLGAGGVVERRAPGARRGAGCSRRS